MKITVTRRHFTSISTIGEMEIDGEFEAFTLEDCDRRLEEGVNEKVPGKTAIPRGIYEVTIDQSARFKRLMPHILDVPQFEGIRIHSGNTPADTEGCILVGTGIAGSDSISNSRAAFSHFFDRLELSLSNEEEITLEVK